MKIIVIILLAPNFVTVVNARMNISENEERMIKTLSSLWYKMFFTISYLKNRQIHTHTQIHTHAYIKCDIDAFVVFFIVVDYRKIFEKM